MWIQVHGHFLTKKEGIVAIFRIHAYSVEPSCTSKNASAPKGGSIKLTSKLVESLETNIKKSRFDKPTSIAFQATLFANDAYLRSKVHNGCLGLSRARTDYLHLEGRTP